MNKTWGEYVSLWQQGRHGFYAVRVSAEGKVLDSLGSIVSTLLRLGGALEGMPSLACVVFVRVTLKFSSILPKAVAEGFVVSADEVPEFVNERFNLTTGKWFGPTGDQLSEQAEIADYLSAL